MSQLPEDAEIMEDFAVDELDNEAISNEADTDNEANNEVEDVGIAAMPNALPEITGRN